MPPAADIRRELAQSIMRQRQPIDDRSARGILAKALAKTPEQRGAEVGQVGRGVFGPAWQQIEAAAGAMLPDLGAGKEYYQRAGSEFGRGNVSGGILNALTGLSSQALEGADFVPGLGAGIGAISFHGTPNRWLPEPDFPQGRPRLDKMGTGEGAQVYGHGFYSAEAPGVAKEYYEKLSNPENIRPDAEAIAKYKNQWDAISEKMEPLTAEMTTYPKTRSHRDIFEDLVVLENQRNRLHNSMIEETAKRSGGGGLYKLDIPDADLERYLDWDAPLSEQPEAAVKMAGQRLEQALGGSEPIMEDVFRKFEDGTMTGQELYQLFGDDVAASEALRAAGIPGLKYFDQGSRVTARGKIVDISETADGWRAKVRVDNRGGLGFTAPTDAITTSKPYATKAEAEKWANDSIGGGTRNLVTWDQDLLNRSTVFPPETP